MKLRATTKIKRVKHTRNVTDLAHSRTGCSASLLVLTIATGPTMPRVRARTSPALLQWREAFRPLWPCRHCAGPPRPRRGPPGFQGVMVLRRIRHNRDATRTIVRLDGAAEERGRDPRIQTGAGNEDGDQSPQRLPPQMPLAPCDCLAAILPALRAPDLGGLDRWARNARGTGGGLTPRFPAGAFAPCLDHRGPCPSVAPPGKVVRDRALGQSIMRQPVPWAPAPVQRDNRLEDFPPVALPRGPSSWALLGRREQRCHDGPWCVREIRGICLSSLVFLQHKSALLCGWDMRSLSNKYTVLPSVVSG